MSYCGTFAQGEGHPTARLTSIDVKHIRAYHAKGLTYKQLAKYYKVEVSTIGKIVRRINWRHVE